MDSETKMLLLAFAAAAGGIALGWCLKMQVRRGNVRSSTAGKSGAAPGAPAPFMIPVGPAPAGCGGCRG